MSDHNTQHIDWQHLWAELDWHEERQEQAIRDRLHQRAEAFAQQSTSTDDAGQMKRILAFQLGEERYGADVMLVRTVRTIEKITTVPGTPAFYRGVVNIRGKIITVIDLRYFFNMHINSPEQPGELLVISTNNLEIGVLAHHIRDVVNIPIATIEPLEDMRFTLGMAPGRLVLLDFARMFEDERLIIGDMDE